MKAHVIGIRKSPNKTNGNIVTNLYLEIPFKDWESSGDKVTALGQKVTSEYIGKDINVKPGDDVILEYEKGYQDKATLVDVTVVKK